MFSPTTIMFISFLAIGAILIAAALLMRKKPESSNDEISGETITVAVNQQIEKSISDADNAMEQLNRMSSMILDELENKYKELLFLYQLVDDKKLDVENLMSETLRLNEIVQSSQAAMPKYPVNPIGVDGYYGGVYYESKQAPVYEPTSAGPNIYSNPNYSDGASVVTDTRDIKSTGGNLFNSSTATASSETAQPTEPRYSSERVPSQYAERYKDIIQLTSEGKTPSEIAQRLNMGQGEIKLILTLARVRQD